MHCVYMYCVHATVLFDNHECLSINCVRQFQVFNEHVLPQMFYNEWVIAQQKGRPSHSKVFPCTMLATYVHTISPKAAKS